MRRRRATAAMVISLMAVWIAPVAAAGTVDVGNVVVGETGTANHELPLAYAMSEVPPETVLYAGGDGTIDGFIAGYGLTPPVTAGDVYTTFGEATTTFHLSLSVPPGTAFSVDGSDCASGTGACTVAIGFSPTATGPHSTNVAVAVTDLDVTYGPGYPSLISLFSGAIEPELERAIEGQLPFAVAGTATNGGSGGVTLEVAVPAPPTPCVILDAERLDFGSLGFSTADQMSAASRQVTVTSCSTGAEAILAQGTDATGDGAPAAAWALSAAGGNPCGNGLDQFGVRLTGDVGTGLAVLQLSTNTSSWMTLGSGGAVPTTVDYQMPCTGSSGAGQTMTSQITFLATMP